MFRQTKVKKLNGSVEHIYFFVALACVYYAFIHKERRSADFSSHILHFLSLSLLSFVFIHHMNVKVTKL